MPEKWTLGYCTNIHPGVDSDAIRQNLESISAEVRRRCQNAVTAETAAPAENRPAARRTASPLGIGLWIPAKASEQLRRGGTQPLAETMQRHGLLPYTINGFPYDNFHQKHVKHAVYRPTWWDDRRLGYTRDLATILADLLPADEPLGTISTLPLGWPRQPNESADSVADSDNPASWSDRAVTEEERAHAGTNLRRLAEDLRRLEDRTGKRIVIAIEPEPGCLLETSVQLTEWFDQQLPDRTHRRYLSVCHDVCHAAVMNEPQEVVLRRYAAAGISIGKVQVSSAVVADWQSIPASKHGEVLQQLAGFAEDRYLHQTGCLDAAEQFRLVEDLPQLLAEVRHVGNEPITDQKWVTHFHVPVFLEHFGLLTTTRQDVLDALTSLARLTGGGKGDAGESLDRAPADGNGSNAQLEFTGHVEVETYAWGVLPAAMRRHDLAGDIARELDWVAEQISQLSHTETQD